MAGLKNKMMPVLSASVALSILLHITVLTALPFFKGFLLFAPLVPDTMVVEVHEGMEHGKTALKARSLLSHHEKKSGKESPEEILAREARANNLVVQNEDGATPNSEGTASFTTSADFQKPEEMACNEAENIGVSTGESEAKGDSAIAVCERKICV